MTREPVITATTIGSIVGAVLALCVVFGLPITNEQVEAILAFVAVVGPVFVSALYARDKVTPQ